ncbi:MAG TPA: S1 RNA-binding domain-containing protein, partial [Trueperaceae bacterium]
GDKVKVEVLDMDLERERINLSMKSLASNPWDNVLANYHIGQKISGKVTNLTPFGAFVEIEPGLEGLIHVSEMSWTKRVRHPKEVVTEGDEVEAMVLKIDTNQQRISLGLRQTQPDPWSSLPDRFPPGTEVTGPITGITDFGVFMEIEEGIEGLVHISELAHEHIEDISQHFDKGDEITAVILNIDPVEQRASLSRKRLLPYSAGEFGGEVPMGAPASRGGARKGRRGGRRSQGIDYDYSYAATDTGAKATTKLGDVYADLFAQFGLTEGKGEAESEPADTEAPALEAQAEAPAEPEVQAEGGAPEVDVEEPTQEAAQPEATPAKGEESDATEDSEVSAENAIDAAEAAALLTAAFRQGKRPAAEQQSQEDEGEKDPETSGA